MTWFFAVLIVLAMGGIAVVAAGRGGPLAPAYDDRPDPDVPATGPLDADDLRRVRFPIVLRGYRMADVDALLDRLAEQRETDRGTGRERGATPLADAPDEGSATPPDQSGHGGPGEE